MKYLGHGIMLDVQPSIGCFVIDVSAYGWELRRMLAEGHYEVEAAAGPRFRAVLEAGRSELIRTGIAVHPPAELKRFSKFWPQDPRGRR